MSNVSTEVGPTDTCLEVTCIIPAKRYIPIMAPILRHCSSSAGGGWILNSQDSQDNCIPATPIDRIQPMTQNAARSCQIDPTKAIHVLRRKKLN